MRLQPNGSGRAEEALALVQATVLAWVLALVRILVGGANFVGYDELEIGAQVIQPKETRTAGCSSCWTGPLSTPRRDGQVG